MCAYAFDKSSSDAKRLISYVKHTSFEATDDDICGSLGSHNRVSRSASDFRLANNNGGSNQCHIAVDMHTKITAKCAQSIKLLKVASASTPYALHAN
jgi:hypothetical protein